MKNKTCGECSWFSEGGNRCKLFINQYIFGDREACNNFAAKKPTNGDVVRQMSNKELAELIDNSCKACAKDVTECDTECVNGILAWLNAPAESEGEDE